MTEDDALNNVEQLMSFYGVAIQRIPTAKKQKRPDFQFEWDGERYVVEMKQRDAKWQFDEEDDAALDSGQIVSRQESIGYYHGFAEHMLNGSQQISAYKPAPGDFRLIWYWTHGTFADLAATRIATTLLGDVLVLEYGSARKWQAHFFDDNLITRLRSDVDGAVIGSLNATGVTIQLVLNPFSCRYQKLRKSRLAGAFSNGVTDSLQMEKAGEVLIVDEFADRSSERALLNYLGKKYSIEVPQILRMGHMAAVIRPNAQQ